MDKRLQGQLMKATPEYITEALKSLKENGSWPAVEEKPHKTSHTHIHTHTASE